MSTSSPADPTRALTPREREAIIALLERGTNIRNLPITTADRARWLTQVPHTLAGRSCGCGICPSIELTDAEGHTPATVDGRVVLQAEAPGAVLMLFVDEDRLSYLELAAPGGRQHHGVSRLHGHHYGPQHLVTTACSSPRRPVAGPRRLRTTRHDR